LVLSLQSNGLLNKELGRALADALKGNSILTELDVSSNYNKYNTSSQDGPGFAQELAVGIRDNGALLVLSLKNNRLATTKGGKALAQALVGNSTLQELDVSSNTWKDAGNRLGGDGPGFARELAIGIKDNGALSTVAMNKFSLPIQDIKTKAKLDFSGKELNSLDAIVIAALLPLNVS
jgi:hypothetical protein